jgi:hypothetical protein
VSTKEINQAVNRIAEKFPNGYIFELSLDEKKELVTNCDRFTSLKHSTVAPKAFTERGLYMLATILRSPKAVNTTIAIIDTFAQLKEITKAIYDFSKAETNEKKIKIFENSTEVMANLLDNELTVSQHETQFKLKIPPFLEISRKITRVKKVDQ